MITFTSKEILDELKGLLYPYQYYGPGAENRDFETWLRQSNIKWSQYVVYKSLTEIVYESLEEILNVLMKCPHADQLTLLDPSLT